MSINEEMDLSSTILEVICSSCSQPEVDYFVHCICTNKQDIAFQNLIAFGFSEEQSNAFINQIEQLHLEDLEKIRKIQEILKVSYEELVELANTILRVGKCQS